VLTFHNLWLSERFFIKSFLLWIRKVGDFALVDVKLISCVSCVSHATISAQLIRHEPNALGVKAAGHPAVFAAVVGVWAQCDTKIPTSLLAPRVAERHTARTTFVRRIFARLRHAHCALGVALGQRSLDDFLDLAHQHVFGAEDLGNLDQSLLDFVLSTLPRVPVDDFQDRVLVPTVDCKVNDAQVGRTSALERGPEVDRSQDFPETLHALDRLLHCQGDQDDLEVVHKVGVRDVLRGCSGHEVAHSLEVARVHEAVQCVLKVPEGRWHVLRRETGHNVFAFGGDPGTLAVLAKGVCELSSKVVGDWLLSSC
jgi:hypothetical protein